MRIGTALLILLRIHDLALDFACSVTTPKQGKFTCEPETSSVARSRSSRKTWWPGKDTDPSTTLGSLRRTCECSHIAVARVSRCELTQARMPRMSSRDTGRTSPRTRPRSNSRRPRRPAETAKQQRPLRKAAEPSVDRRGRLRSKRTTRRDTRRRTRRICCRSTWRCRTGRISSRASTRSSVERTTLCWST